MVLVLHNLKYISLESVSSFSQRQDLLEAKLSFVTANQEAMGNKKREMDDKMKDMSSR